MIPPPETEMSCFVMLPFCSLHPTSQNLPKSQLSINRYSYLTNFFSLSFSVQKNLMWDAVNKMATLQNSLFPFPVAELFQAPLEAGLSNNLMETRSKCLWVKCRGPWTKMSCGECLRNLDPSTKSMSSVIKLLVKVKVRWKKQRLIFVVHGVRVRWVVKFLTLGYQIKYSPIKVNKHTYLVSTAEAWREKTC